METLIESNMVGYLFAYVTCALFIGALVQASMSASVKRLNDTSDCSNGGSWRNHMTRIACSSSSVFASGMLSGRVLLLPRNTTIRHTRAHRAPVHGKE
jgi:hypothetical protein